MSSECTTCSGTCFRVSKPNIYGGRTHYHVCPSCNGLGKIVSEEELKGIEKIFPVKIWSNEIERLHEKISDLESVINEIKDQLHSLSAQNNNY